jgi:hypothetical protein
MKDMFIKLDTLPSAQVVEKVQFLAKKLVDNMNVLGKMAVQGQYLKGGFEKKIPSEAVFETMKREASEAVLQTKQHSVPAFTAKPQLIKLSELSKEPQRIQKNLSLKELLKSKKNNASFEIIENQVITETDPSFETSQTSRELKSSLDERKRVTSRSPISTRRATVNKRELSKELTTEPFKEKQNVNSKLSAKLKIVSQEPKTSKTPPPFYRKAESRPIKPRELEPQVIKDDFLQELEKELASLNGDEWLENELALR